MKLWNFSILLAIFWVSLANSLQHQGKFSPTEEVFTWKKVEYENLPKSEKSRLGPHAYYIPQNNDIIGMGFHPLSGLMIVNILRSRPGVPTSLGAFCIKDYMLHKVGTSPKIWAFPNYEINALHPEDFSERNLIEKTSGKLLLKAPNETEFYNVTDYSGFNFISFNQFSSLDTSRVVASIEPPENPRIISAFCVTIDERCNRAFLVDNGQLQYNQNITYIIQKPALVVIDLPADGCDSRNFSIIRRSELPDRISEKGSNGFLGVTLDFQNEDSCEDLFLYFPNAFYSYLVVYDYKNDDFWEFEHESFLPVRAESHFIFNRNFRYDLEFGIYSITLSYAPDKNGVKTAFYAPLASTAQFGVSTMILKDKTKSPTNYEMEDFELVGYKGCNHQTTNMVTDHTYGVIFFSEVQSNQIRCWNMNKPLNPDNIGVVYESKKLLLGIQISIDSLGYLWFHSCRIAVDFLSDYPLNLHEVNSRFFRIKVSEAINGTVCED
ncbi:L-dopachrome tautomerase yellow-f2-like [Lutzomyia longipalpis]|uniref:L-dopachrome tautomerase yellow-f2-like n=1 Tax=Lutzomyia longipalpis TaxID=7200 RepID=UPI0024842AC8|nr:L-dopachrome tautomerase yellow-f2-like [Lutzomyia longipalpis]